MKKIYQITLLLFVFFLFSPDTYAIHIKTQTELETFVTQHPNLSEYTGDLIIGAYLDISWGAPYGNTDINDLSGLHNLKKVIGNFFLVKFKGGNLSALNNLEEVTGSFIVTGTPTLKNLEGLSKMHTIGAEFIVSHNYLMEDISGFASDVHVQYSVVIDSNETMVSLNGYGKIKCDATVMLCFNPVMTDMSAFQGVSKVDRLLIFENKEIEELTFLSDLTTVTVELSIHNNPKLFTLDGLSNLESVPILKIYSNPSLYDCDAQGVCDRIKAGNLYDVLIANNKTGCNSIDEISCLVANENVSELEQMISISPNPSTGIFFLKVNQELKIKKINIINNLGQVVYSFANAEEIVDLNDLKAGIYLMQLSVDNQVVTKRLIIE